MPLWIYRLLMLLWALWLAISVLGWLRWGWGALNVGGIWIKRPPKKAGSGGLFNRNKSDKSESNHSLSENSLPKE